MSDEWDWEFTDKARRQFDDLEEYAREWIISKLDEIVDEPWRDPQSTWNRLTGYRTRSFVYLETGVLINLYTLLSDVQRGANDLRKEVADVLLARVHHDRPIAGQYGSVQRTSRRQHSLKDEDEVLATLEAAGIDREQATSVDRDKVEDALAVTELSESDVFEISDSEYVRKADVDEEQKASRLQGLKDRLAASEDPQAQELREEIDDLEARIEELTEFDTASEFYTGSQADP